jgi:hypothetical protein
MPFVAFDDTVSGIGSASLGASQILYVATEVTVDGPQIHHPNEWDLTTLLGVGFWQLGNDITSGGIITGVAWAEPHWIHTDIAQWIAPPGLVGADFSIWLADHIQWTITPGTSVHLVVFANA